MMGDIGAQFGVFLWDVVHGTAPQAAHDSGRTLAEMIGEFMREMES